MYKVSIRGDKKGVLIGKEWGYKTTRGVFNRLNTLSGVDGVESKSIKVDGLEGLGNEEIIGVKKWIEWYNKGSKEIELRDKEGKVCAILKVERCS